MSPTAKISAATLIAIVLFGGVFAAYYFVTQAELTSQDQRVSSFSSSLDSLLSHPIISTFTSDVTSARVTSVAQTVTRFPGVPWDYVEFLAYPNGCSSLCFGFNLGQAILFSCPNPSTQGCSVVTHNDIARTNVSITAWYPKVGQGDEPTWANCAYNATILPGGQPLAAGQGFAYCVNIGPTAFLVAVRGAGPD
jgi:hypothetical protein